MISYITLRLKSLIENEEIVCGQSIIMSRSIVENVHAIVEEDEAQGHFGINSDKSSQRITREDMKRNLGRYTEGLKAQFDIEPYWMQLKIYQTMSHNQVILLRQTLCLITIILIILKMKLMMISN